jgi:phytoene/squalene synthetase
LTNFYQDFSLDLKKNRIYLPSDEMKSYCVEEKLFDKKEISVNLQQLLKHQIVRAEELFIEGENLLKYLSGLLKIEITWTINGGKRILAKIKNSNYDVILNRPVLSKFDFILLFFKSLF